MQASESSIAKSGGAVVTPRGDHIQQAVDETEIGNGTPVKSSDVQVVGPVAAPPRQVVVLVYRIAIIYFVCVASVGVVMLWCGYFVQPKTWETHDANVVSRDAVRTRLKSLETFLSLPRALFSAVMTAVLSVIVAVFCLDDNLHAERTTGGKTIEWLVKHGLPYIFCLPLVGLIFQEQPMDVWPVIGKHDLGVYDSLLVTASNSIDAEFGNGSLTRTATTNTILRRVLLPPRNRLRRCDIAESQSANEFTSVAYEFLANNWQENLLPLGMAATETYVVPGSARTSKLASTKTAFTPKEAELVEALFTRGVYLYADAAMVRDADIGGTNGPALRQLKLDTIAYSSANTIKPLASGLPADHITNYVRSFFSTTSAWSSLLRANVSDINVEYAKFIVSEDIAFTSVNIDIPLDSAIWHRRLAEVNGQLVEQSAAWPGTGDVEYEFDVANECGPTTCGIQNRGLAPDPKVVAYAVCATDGSDCATYTSSVSMWLFGFGRRIEGDRFELQDPPANPRLQKAVLTNPREYHRIAMGILEFNLTDLSTRFDAECRVSTGCNGVSLDISVNATATQQFLTVSRKNTPMLEFGSGFDLSKNHARGRPLVTRYTTGASVSYEIVRPQNFDVYNWPTQGLRSANCSGKMERSIITTELNNIHMEQPLQVTYTAGLFFLFHNARMTTRIENSSMMDFIANDREIRLALTVPAWQAIVGLVFGGIVVLLTLLGLLVYHKRISAWSVGQLQIPSVFVRAFADSNSFPPLFFNLEVHDSDPTKHVINLRKRPLEAVVFGASVGSDERIIICPSDEMRLAKAEASTRQ